MYVKICYIAYNHIYLIYMNKQDLAFNNQKSARGVMVIVVGIGHGDTSSNPGPDWLHFT